MKTPQSQQTPSGGSDDRLVRGGVLTILRVYNNGDRLKQTLPHDQAMAEIEYSKAYRWGCALFIGSECVQTGYLGEKRCAAISAEISSANGMDEGRRTQDNANTIDHL